MDPFRRYCRIASVLFLLHTLYPVTTKLLQGRLAGDWLHSLLHLLSGAAAVYAGWLATGTRPARLFTWGIAVVYLALGVVGWFVPGFFMGSVLALPLDVADNVFHLLLGGSAAAVALLARRPFGPASPRMGKA